MSDQNIFCFMILVRVYSSDSHNLHHFSATSECKNDPDQYDKWMRMGKNPSRTAFGDSAPVINQYIDDLTFLVHL